MIGFWIFLLVMDLLIPGTMIWIGNQFISKPPQKINSIFGYRTTMSMKNKDTWQFAHHYCGKIWLRLGWILLPLSVVPMLAVFGKDVGTVGIVGGIICAVQAVFLIGSILPVEIALNRTFDKSGNRKKVSR